MNASLEVDPKTTTPRVGTLWVVATPIGHLGDLTPRAKALLTEVAVIAAEDTRVSRRLVDGWGDQRWVSLNEHSEDRQIEGLLQTLLAGQDVALVSDAGTPLVSDPGYRLVSAAHDAGISVSPIPGACAAVAALSVAGLPSDRFFFEGFLPPKAQARQARLRTLSSMSSSLIFYVPARNLVEVLADMVGVFGAARQATLAREITKQHETIHRSGLADLKAFVSSDPDQCRGEAVVVVAGNPSPPAMISPSVLAPLLKEALSPSQAARVLAGASNLTRQEAWQLITGEGEVDPSIDPSVNESGNKSAGEEMA